MTYCPSCGRLMDPEEILICDDCLPRAPDTLLKVREYCEAYLPDMKVYNADDEFANARVSSRSACEEIAIKCIKQPNKHLYFILSEYIANLYTLEGELNGNDDSQMLFMLETSIGTAEDIINYIGGKTHADELAEEA